MIGPRVETGIDTMFDYDDDGVSDGKEEKEN